MQTAPAQNILKQLFFSSLPSADNYAIMGKYDFWFQVPYMCQVYADMVFKSHFALPVQISAQFISFWH